MARKFKLRLIEYQSAMIVRSPITIDLDDYEILRGLSDEEAIEYIKNNAYDLEPTSDAQTWADSLYDEILDANITREKDLGSSTEIESEYIAEENDGEDNDEDGDKDNDE